MERLHAEEERLCAEEERRAETRELQYYSALETKHEKLEIREKRALYKVDRLRGDREGIRSVDYITLSE